jgi:hypothetical protein
MTRVLVIAMAYWQRVKAIARRYSKGAVSNPELTFTKIEPEIEEPLRRMLEDLIDSHKAFFEIVAGSPLSSEARMQKRNLLAASLLGFAISLGGLLPTRIGFFGIELKTEGQNAIYIGLSLVIAYFLYSFVYRAHLDLGNSRFQRNYAWMANALRITRARKTLSDLKHPTANEIAKLLSLEGAEADPFHRDTIGHSTRSKFFELWLAAGIGFLAMVACITSSNFG